MWQRYLAAIAGGAILPLAFAPFGIWPVAIVSPAVLLLVIRGISMSRAALAGWLYGLGMFGCGVWWVQVSIHQFGVPYYAFSVSVTAVLIAGMACYPALFAGLMNAFSPRQETGRLIFSAPALWVLAEWLRATLFSGFPWLSLGYSQIDSPLAGFVPIVGIYGCSLVVVVIAAAVVALVFSTLKVRVAFAIAIGAIVIGGERLTHVNWTRAAGPKLTVVLVQGAVPQAIKWHDDMRQPTLELYQSLTEPHWDADIVIWPETAIPAFPFEVPETIQALQDRASETNTDLLIGILSGEPWNKRYFNSIIDLGSTPGRYDKRHLVPFGEVFPSKGLLRDLALLLDIPMSDFTPGREDQTTVEVAGYAAGLSICYEDAFPREIARALPDAAFLVNVSNDAWFGDTIAPHQHLEIARMRALETGRYLLRGTNTGITAVIDHRGNIVAQSAQFEPNSLRASLSPRTGVTPYTRLGDRPLLAVLFLVVVLTAIASRRRAVRKD
ncbi:MAG: apolipoprotein N-acyltransferase [Gammaproteobacteria bacterium]|nr:apolipoprotein N-acyltransferase [Gammaproteobacteria bacterium]